MVDSAATTLFCKHVVTLVDILSQGDALERLEHLPTNKAQEEQYVKLVKKTFGTVRVFREAFENAVSGYLKAEDEDPLFQSFPKNRQDAIRRADQLTLNVQKFSDTLILYSPLTREDSMVTAKGIFAMLLACASMQITYYGAGLMFRGAIALGVAAEIGPGEIYGPGLARAYFGEQKVARHPRIVVDPRIGGFLQACLNNPCSHVIDEANKVYAAACMDYLAADGAGMMFVDFLGKGMQEFNGHDPEMRSLVQQGYQFVSGEEMRFKAEDDKKLAARYEQLRSYYESRLSLWASDADTVNGVGAHS